MKVFVCAMLVASAFMAGGLIGGELGGAFSSSNWLDLGKTLIGTLVGALLAFFVNVRIQQKERERKDKAAGNLMLTILSQQFGDFIQAKAGILSDKEAALIHYPDSPAWNQLNPTFFQFSDELKVNTSDLSFLIESGKSDVLERLIIANTKYHELGHLNESNSEATHEKQKRLEEPSRANPNMSFDAAEAILGSALVGKLDSLAKALCWRIENDQQVYIKAGKTLRAALIEIFGAEGIVAFKPIGANELALQRVGITLNDLA